MVSLDTIRDVSRNRKNRKRLGRGIGSKQGKTCGRGHKGAGSRSGYKRRQGYEGGQFRLYMKLPIRGFSNARFRHDLDSVNLNQIEKLYEDGETVNEQTLREKGYLSGPSNGVKILGNGELTKKVTIEASAISQGARDKLQKAKIAYKLINSAEDEEA